jgi:hypothetical protein
MSYLLCILVRWLKRRTTNVVVIVKSFATLMLQTLVITHAHWVSKFASEVMRIAVTKATVEPARRSNDRAQMRIEIYSFLENLYTRSEKNP